MSNTADSFQVINQEVSQLHETWNLVLDLFEKDETIEVLDQCAVPAWTVIGNALMDSVLLGLTRLITDKDSKKYGRKMRLERLVESESDPQWKSTLDSLLNSLASAAKSIEEHRHNRIAHFDFEHATAKKQLSTLTFGTIANVLEELRSFMNLVAERRGAPPCLYEYTRRAGDGRDIISHIRDGIRLRELRVEVWAIDPGKIIDELRGNLPSDTP